MRIAVMFFVGIMIVVLTNLGYLAGLTLAWIPLFAGGLALAWFLLRARPHLIAPAMVRANVLVLLAVSVFLAMHIWLLLTSGQTRISVGHLLPLFVGVLLLYLYGIYMHQTTQDDEKTPYPIDALAQLLAGPPLTSTFCVALILSAYTLLLLHALPDTEVFTGISARFLERGIIPPITLSLFFWALLLLAGKWGGVWYLRYISTGTLANWPKAHAVTNVMLQLSKKPQLLNEQLRLLWQRSAESYLLPRYINWAVPILGFIGTVLGISLASNGIRLIIGSADGLSKLSGDLGQAIAPLGIAFDTTLIALSLSVVLTLAQTLVQRQEERLLANIEAQLRGGKSA